MNTTVSKSTPFDIKTKFCNCNCKPDAASEEEVSLLLMPLSNANLAKPLHLDAGPARDGPALLAEVVAISIFSIPDLLGVRREVDAVGIAVVRTV